MTESADFTTRVGTVAFGSASEVLRLGQCTGSEPLKACVLMFPVKLFGRLRSWKRMRAVGYGLAIVAGVFLLLALLFVVLGPFAELVGGSTLRQLSGKDKADALNSVRQVVLTAFAGTAALVGVGFTIRTYFLSRRGQVTERYSKAIALLASEKLEERLGGIYALEHVMAESKQDHAAVVAIICSFVRARTILNPAQPRRHPVRQPASRSTPPWGKQPPADIDAAMTVLARRPIRDEPNRPDLRDTTLHGLSIRSFDFADTPRLTRMFLTAADLQRADLRGADLCGTILNYATLRMAILDNARLAPASLHRADLRGASLDGTDLSGALLEGADLRGARGLTAEQLSHALFDASTRLPPELADDPWIIRRLRDCEQFLASPAKRPWGYPPATPRPTERAEWSREGVG